MDPQSLSFTPQSDFWRLSGTMRVLQETQQEHADRLVRLERRQEEDARMKSVWGSASPFPGVLSGTPHQGPYTQNPSGDFDNFDDDHSNNMVRSLHLDAEEEPKRLGVGSRANSVRFDESANQGQWAHASRSSIDVIPRTSSVLSGVGGHPLLERTASHKSDGRQSSAGQSASGRANSFGFDSSNPFAQSSSDIPGLAPGLFILGSVPSIIRCWLNNNFKHDSLLYAAVCTGSYKSLLDLRLITKLGVTDQVVHDINGTKKIKLPVYLPEAIPYPASSRSNSPAPQLPTLSVDFTVVDRGEAHAGSKAIQIFLGSDTLRAHNADIMFSSNSMTLFDDERSKLSIPLVRPENDETFKSLYITSAEPAPQRYNLDSVRTQPPLEKLLTDVKPNGTPPSESISGVGPDLLDRPLKSAMADSSKVEERQSSAFSSRRASAVGFEARGDRDHERKASLSSTSKPDIRDGPDDIPTAPLSSRNSISSAWGSSSWRAANGPSAGQADWASISRGAGSGSARPTREQGMKVLKPIRQPSRSAAAASSPGVAAGPLSAGVSPSASQSRFFDEGRRRVTTSASGTDSEDSSHPLRPSASAERERGGTIGTAKENAPPSRAQSAQPKSANPIGGASAFGWLNSAQKPSS